MTLCNVFRKLKAGIWQLHITHQRILPIFVRLEVDLRGFPIWTYKHCTGHPLVIQHVAIENGPIKISMYICMYIYIYIYIHTYI